MTGASVYEKEVVSKLRSLDWPEADEAAALIKRLINDRAALRAELRNTKRRWEDYVA